MLAERVADRTGTPPARSIAPVGSITLGLDSADAVRLVGELEDFVGRPLSASLPYTHPTIQQLARCLANGDD